MTICVLIVTLSLSSLGYELGLNSILRLDRAGETGKGDLIQVKSAISGDSSLTNEQKLENTLSNLMTDRCLFYVFYYL